MNCPSCGHENPDHAKFCNGCASPLSFTNETEHLRETLDELQSTLESAKPMDPELREALRETMLEINQVLKRPRPLSSRLSKMALEFEADHPTIAGTLNRLTHMLSNLGI